MVDPQFDERNFLVHDYLFAKGMEKVKPGGLMVFITSKGTLDKVNSGLRDYLHERAAFVGAVRLPNTAFKQNANTEVTTDILFLRKLATGERPAGPTWLKLAEHRNAEGVAFQMNEYFVANSHMMLGTMAEAGNMYRGNEAALIPDGRELSDALRAAVAALPQRIYQMPEETANSRAVAPVEILAPDFVKENAFVLHEGVITIRTRPTLTPVLNRPDETARRIRGLVKLRDAVRETLRTQLQDSGEEAVLDARRALNFQYDHFISRFGAGNENANRRAFRGDPAEKRLFLAETQASGLLVRCEMPDTRQYVLGEIEVVEVDRRSGGHRGNPLSLVVVDRGFRLHRPALPRRWLGATAYQPSLREMIEWHEESAAKTWTREDMSVNNCRTLGTPSSPHLGIPRSQSNGVA